MSVGGRKQIVISSQERALSTDINRIQKMGAKDSGELLRYMLNVYRSEDDTIGTLVVPNTVETPLRAEIIEGLMAKPQLASTSILVDAGCLMAMAPDAVADESDYKFVNDPGVGTLGVLVIGANASGSIRIDVIECRINPVEAIVTDNRDIFNPTTGLFTATVVTKETTARLEYRVRAGTGGAGFPGSVAGWLPLCVASVPNGSVSNDTVTFWDVRPLVDDRYFGQANLTRDMPINFGGQAMGLAGGSTLGGQAGIVDLVDFKGRRLGGRLRSSMPSTTEGDSFNWQDPDNNDVGATPAFGTNAFAYFLTPFGLPRWARYHDSTATRLPQSPRGLVVISLTGPDSRGRPSAAIALPPSSGLSGATTEGVCFAQTRSFGTGPRPISYSNKVQLLPDQVNRSVSATSIGVGTADFLPLVNDHFPQNARALWVSITISRTVANGTAEEFAQGKLAWYRANSATNHFTEIQLPSGIWINNSGGASLVSYSSGLFCIPVPSEYPSLTLTTPLLRLTWLSFILALTIDTGTLNIHGWEF